MAYKDPAKRLAAQRKSRDKMVAASGTRLCECGCGTTIPVLDRNGAERKWVPGHHKVRPDGHTLRHSQGYILERTRSHPRAHNGYVYQHILVWERENGELVPDGWHVHHINEDKTDNRPANLVAMPAAEHGSLHFLALGPDELRRRQSEAVKARRARRASGTPTPPSGQP